MAEQNEPRQRYGYTTESGERVSALRDMFNGGGAGQAGERFEGGGILSRIGNVLGGPQSDGGGMLSPGRIAGGALGGALFGPVGGILGSILGGQIGRNRQPVAMPDETAASLMAPVTAPAPAPAPVAPALASEMYGMTSMPALTAEQIRLLREMGIDTDAMAGEPASHSELAALLRGPGALLGVGGPNAMTTAPMQPGMNVMPDGETFLRQNLAVIPAMTGPSMNMPQTDIGTVRPFVSRSTGRIPPMMDMPPMRGVTNPPPMSAMLLPR